jgi:tetratricopeptide (TPR) repeat protein
MRKTGWALLIAAALAVAAPQQRDMGNVLNDRGTEALERGDFAEAERLLDQTLQPWRPLGSKYDAHLATALYNKAEAQSGLRKWREAAANLEESVPLMGRSLGLRHWRTIHCRNALANVYQMLGERDKSEALYKETLAVERELDPNDGETARTLVGLAMLSARAGKLDEALPLAEEALRIGLRAHGEKDPETAMLYSTVAQIHTLAGRTERALPLIRKARAIYESAPGVASWQIGLTLSQEGLALLYDGKRALAERDFQEALRRLSECAPCGLELAAAESQFALLRLQQHKFNEADALLAKAISIEEGISERPLPEMATTLEILSKLRVQEKRIDDAEQLHARAQTILAYR